MSTEERLRQRGELVNRARVHALTAVLTYGEHDDAIRVNREGGIWNDHPAVQSALAVLAHEGDLIDDSTPKDRPILVWWPIVLVDQECNLTTYEVDGEWLVTEWNGNGWLEPHVLNSLNSNPNSFGDDREYAELPTHWRELPPKRQAKNPDPKAT